MEPRSVRAQHPERFPTPGTPFDPVEMSPLTLSPRGWTNFRRSAWEWPMAVRAGRRGGCTRGERCAPSRISRRSLRFVGIPSLIDTRSAECSAAAATRASNSGGDAAAREHVGRATNVGGWLAAEFRHHSLVHERGHVIAAKAQRRVRASVLGRVGRRSCGSGGARTNTSWPRSHSALRPDASRPTRRRSSSKAEARK